MSKDNNNNNNNNKIVIGIDVSKKKLNLSRIIKGKFSDSEIENNHLSINKYLSKKEFFGFVNRK